MKTTRQMNVKFPFPQCEMIGCAYPCKSDVYCGAVNPPKQVFVGDKHIATLKEPTTPVTAPVQVNLFGTIEAAPAFKPDQKVYVSSGRCRA